MAARFVEPMLLLATDALPSNDQWAYELKLDGYRALAFKHLGVVHLRSRNDRAFNARYPAVVAALANLPDDTVVDGEIVAFDREGRPSFNALQHSGSTRAVVVYYLFDLMVLAGRDVMRETLEARRALLEAEVLPHLLEPVRYTPFLQADLPALIKSVEAHGLEGLVAKRRASLYEPGVRSGAWLKMRVNRRREFVIGGYTRGSSTFDGLVFGLFSGNDLFYVARTRSGFTPTLRAALFRRLQGLETDVCPFVNLPETRSGRWGQGLTRAKMAECRWVQPVLVAEVEFLEWTADDHLRHSRFVRLRDDKIAKDVQRA